MRTADQPANHPKITDKMFSRLVRGWLNSFDAKLPTEHSLGIAFKIYAKRLAIFLAMVGVSFIFPAIVGPSVRLRLICALALLFTSLALGLWVMIYHKELQNLRAQRPTQVEMIPEPRGDLSPYEREF